MNPYSRFSSFSAAIYFLLIGISFTFIRDWIKDPINVPAFGLSTNNLVFDFILFLLVALAALVFVEQFLLPNFKQFVWFRKIILREHYIEGTWIQDVVSPQGRRSISVVKISPLGDGLSITGSNYYYRLGDDNQTIEEIIPAGKFSSTSINISWPIITYTYNHHRVSRIDEASMVKQILYSKNYSVVVKSVPDNNESEKEDISTGEDERINVIMVGKNEGIGEIQFETENGSVPRRFDGYFHHLGLELAHSVTGYKCSSREVNQIGIHGERIKFLQDRIEEFGRSKVYLRKNNSNSVIKDKSFDVSSISKLRGS